MSRLTHCRLCGEEAPEVFMDLGNQPFANALHNGKDFQQRHPLALAFCHRCSLVQLTHTAPPEELFSAYLWVTGTAETTRTYAKEFARKVLKHKPDAQCVLEIASNDGTFLREFQKLGLDVMGVDPAANISDMARLSGIPTWTAFFGKKVAQTIVDESGQGEVVIARNVLPHVADPHDFLAGFAHALKQDGVGVIEIHHAQIILEELHYDSIYHEHLCYFTAHSFEELIKRHGLYAYDTMESPISGGSRVFFVSKEPRAPLPALTALREAEIQASANDFATWQNFAAKSADHRQALLNVLNIARKDNKKIFGYGASARSSTMLNYCGIGADQIHEIADQNPLKHGLFSPGSDIPIVSPEKMLQGNPDIIIILAWNFYDEIATTLRNKYGFSGELIKPLPVSPTLAGAEGS